jgi:AraC-like DNA-binding protein
MGWVERINAVLDYIEDNLDGEMDTREIELLYAGPYAVFQRVFANITDMPLSEYIRKRKLTQAANDLKKGKTKIIDLAVKYEYASAAAFSAAFKRFHGVSPSKAGQPGIKINSFYKITFSLSLTNKGDIKMEYYTNENANFIMRQVLDEGHRVQSFRTVLERNGAKCATDGKQVLVMLPQDSGDFTDIYFDMDEKDRHLSMVADLFNHRADGHLCFDLTKEQVAIFLVSLDGAKIDQKRKYVSLSNERNEDETQEAIIFINLDSMGITTETTVANHTNPANKTVMCFNPAFVENAFKFILCSDNPNVKIIYNGQLSALLIKSGRFYAAVLPLRVKK